MMLHARNFKGLASSTTKRLFNDATSLSSSSSSSSSSIVPRAVTLRSYHRHLHTGRLLFSSTPRIDTDQADQLPFNQLFRKHVSSFPLELDQSIEGRVVAKTGPKSFIIDFGIDHERKLPYPSESSPQKVGDRVVGKAKNPADGLYDFGPIFTKDHDLIQRYQALVSSSSDIARKLLFVHGRVVAAIKGGYRVKVMGFDAFLPFKHSSGIPYPVVGRFTPLVVLQLHVTHGSKSRGGPLSRNGEDRGPWVSFANVVTDRDNNSLNVHMVVSAYVSNTLIMSNLVGSQEQWEASGGGSDKERLGYLRYLTNMLFARNYQLRSAFTQSRNKTNTNWTSRARREIHQQWGPRSNPTNK